MATSLSDRSVPPAGRHSGPTPEEVAAIVAAVTMAWPSPPAPAPPPRRRPAWRFSGRWWAPDDVVRRSF